MDPSIMKKLLEDDEDETMHSGADVEAFQAALNRDIEGDVSASQRSDSDSAILSQGSNNTSSQSLPQLHTASQDESTAGQIQHDQNIAQQREMHSYEMELKQQRSISENMPQQNDASQELNHFTLPQKQPNSDLQQGQGDQKPPQTGMLMSGKNPVSTKEQDLTPKPENESQYVKLQKMSSQQAMTTEQPSTPMNRSKQVPFGLLLPVLLPQLDKDRAMQLTTLFGKLKNNEISKDAFVRHIRSVVGDQMLKMAVHKVQTQPALKQQLMPQASLQQQPPRMPSISAGATQFTDPRFAIHQRGANPSTDTSHIPTVHVQTDSSHSAIENNAKKLREAERQSDSHAMQVNQMSSSSTGAANQERERSSVPMQVHNKQQQQQLHYPQSSFAMYGSTGGKYHPYPGANVNTMPLKQQSHDSHLRQIPQHQSMGSAQPGGVEAQGTNIMSVPKLERQNSMNDPSRQQGGSHPHFTNNSTLQQNPVPWQSSNKEQISGPLSSMAYVKQEPIDQSAEQQHKTPLSNSQRLPYASSVQLEQGNASPGISMDESLEKQSSRMGFSSTGPTGSMVPSSSTSTGPLNPVSSSTTTQADPNLISRMPTGTSPAGINNRVPAKKTSVGQKKPSEALGSSPPPSSKKQKVSGAFLDQSIEQLNDVTAVSGVNLREEEEQLFSGPKDDGRASEASRRVVQEEEERLILQKTPLQKKLAEIMFRCGLKSISNDVERCLSLCVEERMRGLINNLIRLSKQRVDAEKPKHHTIITSDVQQQILNQNKKAKEEWEKKQAEAEKVRKLNEPEVSNGVDGDKDRDEGRSKSFKVNKEEDDKMRTTAANVAARAAVGGDDMLSKWQLMAEQARQKREGGSDVASGSQPGKDVNRKPTSAAGRIMKDNQEVEKRGGVAPVSAAGTVRKFGKNQFIVPQTRVARSISVKDVISVLEREPQTSKSPLIYRLYERNQSDSAGD
ncbi:transcription initiation factor TFIID subunit 4b [Rosa sericea]